MIDNNKYKLSRFMSKKTLPLSTYTTLIWSILSNMYLINNSILSSSVLLEYFEYRYYSLHHSPFETALYS